jgi:hypothetical protein
MGLEPPRLLRLINYSYSSVILEDQGDIDAERSLLWLTDFIAPTGMSK